VVLAMSVTAATTAHRTVAMIVPPIAVTALAVKAALVAEATANLAADPKLAKPTEVGTRSGES